MGACDSAHRESRSAMELAMSFGSKPDKLPLPYRPRSKRTRRQTVVVRSTIKGRQLAPQPLLSATTVVEMRSSVIPSLGWNQILKMTSTALMASPSSFFSPSAHTPIRGDFDLQPPTSPQPPSNKTKTNIPIEKPKPLRPSLFCSSNRLFQSKSIRKTEDPQCHSLSQSLSLETSPRQGLFLCGIQKTWVSKIWDGKWRWDFGGSQAVGENKAEVVEERVVEDSNGVKDDVEEEVFEEAIETGTVGDSPRAEDFEEAIEVLDEAEKSKEEEEAVENGGEEVEKTVGGDSVDGFVGTSVDVEETSASKYWQMMRWWVA